MAFAVNTTTNAAIFKSTFTAEFGLEPYEEPKVSGFVATPYGTDRIGNVLYLRKIKAVVAGKYTGSTGLPANLSASTANTELAPSTTLAYGYAQLELDEPALTRLIDDAAYRTGIRTQMRAAVNSQKDADLLALAASLSHSEVGAALNETMFASGLGQLATYAMNKYEQGVTDVRLFLTPTQLKNVIVIPALKEYQIRGGAGTAATGQLVTAHGIRFAESGNVYSSAGAYYNALILKEAWAIGHNILGGFLPDQQDGIVTRLIFRIEYGTAEWFDSCGVALIT